MELQTPWGGVNLPPYGKVTGEKGNMLPDQKLCVATSQWQIQNRKRGFPYAHEKFELTFRE